MRRISWQPLAVVALLMVLVGLLVGPLRNDSATMDEPLVLTCGYRYWKSFTFRLNPEQPPLGQALAATPLLFMDVNWTRGMENVAELRVRYDFANPWYAAPHPLAELFPQGQDDWYFWPVWEGYAVSDAFVFGGQNDADRLILAGRLVQVGITLLIGVVIALWLRAQAGATAAVWGVALWALNPLVLAYGHLIVNDMGVALFMTLAAWAFSRFLIRPSARRAALVGLATGGAFLMKFSALLLLPVFLVMLVIWWLTRPSDAQPAAVWRLLALAIGVAYAVVLVGYAPRWQPAPPISAERADLLNVPSWFRLLRPVLVPPDFFKGIAIQWAHAKTGHAAFFAGQWRMKGWWYYFPALLALKSPLPLLALAGLGAGLAFTRLRRLEFARLAPWVAALTYLGCSLAGTIDIGVRYMLPFVALVTVGIAAQLATAGRALRVAGVVLTAWLAVVAVRAHPHFIEYFNECAGGPARGWRWAVDSNYDWGQDVKRLRNYLAARGHPPVYLVYFGPRRAVDYYGIRYTGLTMQQAQELRTGTLIVSVSELMQPRWNWLREQRQPTDRIGYTLFLYQLGG
jgi:4-amino-4-deoxy-L-arabinose transferase-like glycosyltransferase